MKFILYLSMFAAGITALAIPPKDTATKAPAVDADEMVANSWAIREETTGKPAPATVDADDFVRNSWAVREESE